MSTSKVGIKGPAAAEWLQRQGMELPAAVFEIAQVGGGGLIVRLGAAEYLIEIAEGNVVAGGLESALGLMPPGAYCIPRCETTLSLRGPGANSVLAQTCGIDFREVHENRVVFTRVAGVNCGVFRLSDIEPCFRIWVDHTYCEYLWAMLVEIAAEFGGIATQSSQPL